MLETERLVLRLPVAGDAPSLLEAFADPEVMRYIGTGETGNREDAAAQLEKMRRAWKEDGFGRFVVVRKSDGATLGRVGLLAWDPLVWRSGLRSEIGGEAEIELGWTLARHAWGEGFATEAARAAAEWAVREVRPRRLISLIHPENVRSKRVAAKLGEQLERVLMTHRGVEAELWTF